MARQRHKKIQELCYVARRQSDGVLVRLYKLKDIFAPAHPEYLPLLEALGTMQVMFQAALGDFFFHAWGRRPAEFPDLVGPRTETTYGEDPTPESVVAEPLTETGFFKED